MPLAERHPVVLHQDVRDILARRPVKIQFLKSPLGVHFEKREDVSESPKHRRALRHHCAINGLILRVIHSGHQIVRPEDRSREFPKHLIRVPPHIDQRPGVPLLRHGG